MGYGVEFYGVTLKGVKGLDIDSLELVSHPGFMQDKDGDIDVACHSVNWSNDETDFEADLDKLQVAGIHGEVIFENDYGTIIKYRLTDEAVGRYEGLTIFPSDPEETYAPRPTMSIDLSNMIEYPLGSEQEGGDN